MAHMFTTKEEMAMETAPKVTALALQLFPGLFKRGCGKPELSRKDAVADLRKEAYDIAALYYSVELGDSNE